MPILIKNRYGNLTPTSIQANGASISVPIYISLAKEQNKALLNALRDIARKGDNTVEEQLGVNEENLRTLLFGRNGIPERLLVKLQEITGVEVVTRKQIEETYSDWVDYLFD